MKISSIFSIVTLFLFTTLCVTSDVAQAQKVELTHDDFRNCVDLISTSTAKTAAFDLSKIATTVGPNVRMNALLIGGGSPNDLRGRSETTIASDPSGRKLLSGWNDAEGFLFAPFGPLPGLGLSGFAFSSDGGQTWTDGGAPFLFVDPSNPNTKVVTRGDPWMDTGGKGQKTYYYANLGVFEDGSPGGGVTVHRGKFSGGTFAFNNAVLIQPPNGANDFLDKEALCAGKQSPVKRWVVVSVTNFAEVQGIPQFGFGTIEAYTSKNRANSFAGPAIVQADETISVPLNQGIVNQGSACAIFAGGDDDDDDDDDNGGGNKIYVAWERGFLSPFFGQSTAGVFPRIEFARSDDGGQTFGSRVLVSNISSGALFPPSGYNRNTTNDFPKIAVDESGPFEGRIYVTYQDSRIANGGPSPAALGPEDILGVDLGHPDTDVYIRFSDDMGNSWSSPILVSPGGDGNIQFWPHVSVQPDGTVDITYYESVEPQGTGFLGSGPGTSLVDVFYQGSADGGLTFSAPLKVTNVTTDWGATPTNIRPNFGDYIFHVSTGGGDDDDDDDGDDDNGGKVHATWADGRSVLPPVPDIAQPEAFYATITAPGDDDDDDLDKGAAPVVATNELPTSFALNQNHPNPFNPSTNITFALPEQSRVSFTVYDILGREVAELALGELTVGNHRITFDAKDLPSGVYIYKVTAGKFVDTKKMVLLK